MIRAATRSLVLGLVASTFAAAGCIDTVHHYYSFNVDGGYVNPGVFPGNYAYPQSGSNVLNPGPYVGLGKPTIVHLISKHPHYPLPDGLTNEGVVVITLAYWLPVNATGPFPVLVDAGPYFEQGNLTIDHASQQIPFLIKNFLPHGYAVAAVAVRGTGTSGGCMELMGPNEVADLDQAITWLGSQDWSNGNVAMTGASYDGSTPWMVASTGNPHLKTIVPVAGLPDIFDLMFRNGSAEARGPIMGNVVYWPYGFGSEFLPTEVQKSPVGQKVPPFPLGGANGRQAYQTRQNLVCAEAYKSTVMGAYAVAAGDRGSAISDYWALRDHRAEVLKNYKGSVFLVHGLQDWNVDPHAAIPFNVELHEAGIEMKEWYGQWGHAFPDSECAKRAPPWLTPPCRWDYAETLFHWFEHYLKDNTTIPLGPSLQIMDNRGYWRNADSFPPIDATLETYYLDADRHLVPEKPGRQQAVTLAPAAAVQVAPNQWLELKTAPFATDVRVSGLSQLGIDFEADGPGGFFGAWLFDENAEGKVMDKRWFETPSGDPIPTNPVPVIAHGQLDLRFREGGEISKPVVPGMRDVAKLQFEPMDVLIPAGHRLTLWLFQFPYPDHIGSAVPSAVKVYLGSDKTALRLPTIEVDPAKIFPVPGGRMPERKNFDFAHTEKPTYSEVLPPISERADARARCLDAWRGLGDAGYAFLEEGRIPDGCGTGTPS